MPAKRIAHRKDETPSLHETLLSLLGEDGFISLVEAQGGLRLYVPHVPDGSHLLDILPFPMLEKLAGEFGGDYITVPLAREYRARIYRSRGLNARQIARMLGITENGVYRMGYRGWNEGLAKRVR